MPSRQRIAELQADLLCDDILYEERMLSWSEEDLITFSIHYADRVGENYFAKWRPRHDWVFFPDMVPDETLFIKQWDSHGDMAPSRPKAAAGTSTFALHSAFADPHSSPGAPERESIEVRLVVVY